MKKSLLAVALAAAFTTLTFAQAAPPANPPTQDPGGSKTTKKTKKNSKKTKAPKKDGSASQAR